MKGEYTSRYVGDSMPKKPYRRKFVLRDRKPFEIYWHEILIALFIIFMLVMLAVNYVSLREPSEHAKVKPVEIDIDASVSGNETIMKLDVVGGLNPIYLNSGL